jgi:O-antigen ligase
MPPSAIRRFIMGFVLSILYFVTNYLTPPVLFGPLAGARIELIIAALLFFVSLPKLLGSLILKTPQSLALIGLAFAASLSVLVAVRWPGGAVYAFLRFIPNAFAYFMVCLHFNSKKKLQVLVLMLLFVCLFVIANGCIELLHGGQESVHNLPTDAYAANANAWQMEHPYLLPKPNDWEEPNRLKGLGLINDPNDFGQLTVCAIPLMFVFWRSKKTLLNFVSVILPVSALLFGAYLTRSRGALVALVAVAVVAARRRIGTLPALLVAGGLFAAAMAFQFTGGRGISASAGEDRTALWSESLQALKSHPLFGVGLGSLGDYTDSHHTAHNSVAVCAAELGVFGLYFWSLFLFPTLRDALAIASPAKVSEGEPTIPEEELFPHAATKIETLDKAEINRLGLLLVLSLTGFLVAGWFLSRAFVMTFFLLGGMVEVVYEMALRREMIAHRLRLGRVLPYAGILAFALVLVLYIMLRILNLMR